MPFRSVHTWLQSLPAARRTLLAGLAVALLAAAPYLAAEGLNAFVNLDDDAYVYNNFRVREGLSAEGLLWAFTTFETANWHPVTWISHMIDASLFGMSARHHHLVNILLHGLNAALLFLALSRLSAAPWRSALVAALFAVHPLHVESVAWIAERKNLLSSFFFMLVLLAYDRYVRGRGAGWYAAVLVLAAAGLMAKPMLVTLPFLLLLLDVWPLGRLKLGGEGGAEGEKGSAASFLLLEKSPLFVLTALSAAVTYTAQKAEGAMSSVEIVGPAMRLSNAVISYVWYLAKAFWPSSLAVLYPYPQDGHEAWKVAGALLLLVTMTLGALTLRRRRPFLAVGWLWYLGMLVPVIGIVQVGAQTAADRYTYLPLIGIFIIVAWLLPSFPDAGSTAGRSFLLTTALVLVLLMGLTVRQAEFWKDGETLFKRTLALTENNWLIHNNLGAALAREGKHEEAASHYRRALAIRPDYAEARSNLGAALQDLGRSGEAEALFREALRHDPGDATAQNNLGSALAARGLHREAEVRYREALRLDPDYGEAYYNLGNSLAATGRSDEAVRNYLRAARIVPDLAVVHYNLANVLLGRDDLKNAEFRYREALRLQPGYAEAHSNLGVTLYRMGRTDEAVFQLQAALAARPGYEKARRNLERILQGREGVR